MTIEELRIFTKRSEAKNAKKYKRTLKRACAYAFRHALKEIKKAARDGKYEITIDRYSYFVRRYCLVSEGEVLAFLEKRLQKCGFQLEGTNYGTSVMWDK